MPRRSLHRSISRRGFLTTSGVLAAAPSLLGGAGLFTGPTLLRAAEPAAASTAETLAQALHASLSPSQREKICFAWDYVHPKFCLLR